MTRANSRDRVEAWQAAEKLVNPIIEKHGLELVRSGAMFGPTMITTIVDQHIEHILDVANWLLEGDVNGSG